MRANIKRLGFILILFPLLKTSYAQVMPASYGNDVKVNYIRTWDATAPEANTTTLVTRPLKDVKQTTQYFDGLGRPLQTVVKQGSLETSSNSRVDLVSPVVYDDYGREQYKFLPFASTVNDGTQNNGSFKLNPFQQQKDFYDDPNGILKNQGETFYYSKTNFESTPLNRVEESYAPGNSWVGSESNNDPNLRKRLQMKYWLNTDNDAVRIWNVADVANNFGNYLTWSYYGAGQLIKTITQDEHNKQVIEFKDKEGKVVLKRVQLSGAVDDGTVNSHSSDNNDWLSTYYIYDNLNNLRCVVQPEGVKWLAANGWDLTYTSNGINEANEQCFRYEYDSRNRMIMKKVPGSGEVYMIYDGRDRLVMIQDANMRLQGKWMFTKYDGLNRPTETRLVNNTTSFTTLLTDAAGSNDYMPSGTYEVLTITHYDDYTGLPGGLSATFLTTWNSNFSATDLNNWPYPVIPQQSSNTKGIVTWTQTKILNSSPEKWIYTCKFYDNKGKVIQIQNKNDLTGTSDVLTTQYSWAGQPLVNVQQQQITAIPTENIVVTKYDYDDLGRLLSVKKSNSNTTSGNTISVAEKTILSNQYNKIGQLKNKALAPYYTNPFNGATNLETQNYDYNIRGWLLGMNRDYLSSAGQSGTTRFGFELAYDKQTNKTGQNFSTVQQYNGNITGMVWKSDGDDVRRMYSFGYDNANRLLKGDFLQQNQEDPNNNGWTNSKVNYSMQMGDGTTATSAYDANGNIKGMTQFGWKLGQSPTNPIDQLTYSYFANSNKLQAVTDAVTTDMKLGDFTDNNTGSDDYNYDNNGNMVNDYNKNINGITYNYLNLPQEIVIKPKGIPPFYFSIVKGGIYYDYDAAGNKLRKTVVENNANVFYEGSNILTSITTTTDYAGAFIYESKTYSSAPGLNYSNKLQFAGIEDGRIRSLYNNPASPNSITGFAYDYMIKDHLGNVRMVLTDEQKIDIYPVANFEGDQTCAQNVYDINTNKILEKPSNDNQLNYANNNGFNGDPCGGNGGTNVKMYKLFATSSGADVGLGMSLKVMAGDVINIFGKSYYTASNSSQTNYTTTVTQLIAGLLGTGGGSNAAIAKGATQANLGANAGTLAANIFLTDPNRGSGTVPKAYINWVLFDEQFNYITGGFSRVDALNPFKNHHDDLTNIPMTKSGYLYVYASNESPVAVFFDNLQVTHTRGSLIEESHYYPFGLTMAGISSNAAVFGNPQNKFKFNGKEEQRQEFSDGSGLGWLDYGARMYDNQIGKWGQLDPLSELYIALSPNNYVFNNPMLLIDPDGRSTHTNSKGEVVAVYDDCDDGIYKHEELSSWDNTTVLSKKGKGITMVGSTEFWDEFAAHDPKGNILSLDGKGVNFAQKGAHINFDISKEDELKAWNEMWKIESFLLPFPEALQKLIEKSSTYGSFDIKNNNTLGLNIKEHDGYLYEGKYVSGESLGNKFFGMNLETLRLTSFYDDIAGLSKTQVYFMAAVAFGKLHNDHQTPNDPNPRIPPYFGEIPYSGRQVVIGYWNSSYNPIFDQYINAFYGSKK